MEATAPALSLALPSVRSSHVRARWAMILVGVATFALLAAAAGALNGLSLIDRIAYVSTAEVTNWEQSLRSAVGFYAIAYFCAGIAVLAWLSRVVDNVPGLGGGQPDTSPHGAILWWFVPIANFFKPYQVVADVWRRLSTSAREEGAGIVLAWWVLWIGGILVDRAVNAMPQPGDLDGLRSMLLIEAGALGAEIVAGILLIRLIWEVERRSKARATAAAAIQPAPVARPAHVPVATWPAPVLPAPAPALPMPPPANTPGRAIAVSFCPRCGMRRLTDARFCAGCGTDLEAL